MKVKFLLIALLFAAACAEKKAPDSKPDGKLVYERNCALCHGTDGRLGSGGAKDLSVSRLDLSSRVALISYGGNGMTPFKGLLNEKEIEAVAVYVESLRKQ